MSYPLQVLRAEHDQLFRERNLLLRNIEEYSQSLRTGAAIDPSYTRGQVRRNTEEHEVNMARRAELRRTIKILEAIEGL